MKALFLILTISALFLAGVSSVEAQTNTPPKVTTKTNSMNYTLDLDPGDGSKAIHNPTEADIRKAVASLRDDTEPGFLILRKNAGNAIQATCVAKGSFVIQTQEGGENHQFEAVKELSTDATTKLLLAYVSDDPGWKKLTNWKPL